MECVCGQNLTLQGGRAPSPACPAIGCCGILKGGVHVNVQPHMCTYVRGDAGAQGGRAGTHLEVDAVCCRGIRNGDVCDGQAANVAQEGVGVATDDEVQLRDRSSGGQIDVIAWGEGGCGGMKGRQARYGGVCA